MRIISEDEIKKIAQSGKSVKSLPGAKEDLPESYEERQVEALEGLEISIQEAAKKIDQKEIISILERVRISIQKLADKEVKQIVDNRPREWKFTVERDENNFIKSITAKAGV